MNHLSNSERAAKREAKISLTVELVRELLNYDPATGVFTWKRHHSAKRIGTPAGSLKRDGYIDICVAGVHDIRAHRLAWFYVHGAWPAGEIDHRNGVKADNRIDNLRVATGSQNAANRAWGGRGGKLKGATYIASLGKWQAQVGSHGQCIYLGCYDTAGQAHAAYCAAARALWGEFANVGQSQ
jgi:hypothetical protein